MEDLSEAIKVSWEAESGSALQSCQVTPPESSNSPQSDPYSPPAPFPPPPRGLIEEPHCSVQSPPAEANTALISLHIDGASNASDGSSGLNLVESELPEDQVLRIISRYTDAATSRQCILVTLVQGASYGLNFAFDKTGGIDLNSLGVHGVNFLRCNILSSPRIPDFDKMGLSSLFFVKSVDSQVARLRASTAEADETPIIFPAGFDNAAFSRSVRLNPNAPEKFELVRYDIMGTAKEFQNYKTGYGASKREREAWGALIKIFDPAHYTAPLAPELEHMAADFFGGNPVLEPGHYMARYFQDRLQNRNPSRIKSHVVTYHEIAMSDILRQEILKHDMQLSKFLFDTMQNARLQEYQEKSENKIINIRDMIFWTPASKNNYNADPISPGNVEAPTAPSSTAEASEIAFALVDEQTWINEPGIKSGDSTQVELVSAIPVSGKNAKKNAKKRKKAKSKAAQNNKNKGAGASSNTGVAKSYNLSETEWAQAPESIHIGATRQVDNSSLLKETAPYNQANILVGIATISGEEPTKLNHPGVTTKSITVDESLIATSFRVNKSAPTLKLSLIEPYLVDTQNFSRHSVGDASLSVTAGNNTTGELNAVDLADLGDLGSPSHSEFNYQDFNSLYDVSDSDHVAEWNVVQSKSSKKATKQNQSRKHSQPLGGNQLSSNDTSGDNTLRARHQHPQRHIHQRKTEPKLEPKSFKSNITDSFNLNIEEYPPLAPVVPSRALKKEEIFKEIKVAMKAVDGSKSKYEDKDDTGESKTGHKDGVKNDDVEYDAGKGNGGTNHTCKNKTNKYESDKNETEKSAVGMGNNGKDTAATSNAGGTKAGKNTQIDIKTDVVNKKAKNTGSVKTNSARSSGGKSDSPQAESSTHVDFTSSDPLSGPHAEDVCQSFSTQLTDGRSTFQDPDDSLLVEKNMLSAESTDTNDGGDGNSKFSDEFKVVVWTSEAVINLLLGPSQETRKVLTRFKSGSVSDLQRLIAEEDAEYDSEIEEDPSTLRSRAGSVADIYYTAQHDVLSGFHRAAQLNANQESRSAANITVGQQAITHDTYGQDINGQAQFFPNCMTEQYLVSNDNSDEQNVIQQFVSGPATEYSPVVAQSYHPGFNYAVAQYNGNQHTVSTIPHLYAQYPAISTTNPGHNTGLGTTLGDNAGGSSMQTTQQVQTLRSLPAAFAVCTYCMTLPSGGPESQVICPGCGPDHYVRYCSVACLLTDSLDHSLCCLRHPVPPRALDPKIPQEVCRSLTPLAPPLTASVETPERFRQRTFSMFCSSGPFPQILAAWARKMNINLHGVVNGTDWFKKAGDYAIFRSETTGLAGRYNPKADVIFTVILQVNDPRKQYLVRVLNACFIDPRIDLLVFLFRTILILLKDLDFYRLTKYYETREIVIQEFMFQFEREWGLTAAHWVPDTPFDIGLEWLYILKSLETVEYHNPILGQAWPTLYKS